MEVLVKSFKFFITLALIASLLNITLEAFKRREPATGKSAKKQKTEDTQEEKIESQQQALTALLQKVTDTHSAINNLFKIIKRDIFLNNINILQSKKKLAKLELQLKEYEKQNEASKKYKKEDNLKITTLIQTKIKFAHTLIEVSSQLVDQWQGCMKIYGGQVEELTLLRPGGYEGQANLSSNSSSSLTNLSNSLSSQQAVPDDESGTSIDVDIKNFKQVQPPKQDFILALPNDTFVHITTFFKDNYILANLTLINKNLHNAIKHGITSLTITLEKGFNRRLFHGRIFDNDQNNNQDDQEEKALTLAQPFALRYPNLEKLILRGHNVTDNVIIQLAPHLANIVELVLQGCPSITDDSLEALTPHTTKLQLLNIGDYASLTDAALINFAPHTKDLKILNMSSCFHITNNALIALAPNLTNVHDLDISNSGNFTDAALTILASNTPSLTHLNMSRCTKFTDAGLATLAQHRPELELLNLHECRNLTNLTALSQFKKLKTLNLNGINLTGPALEELKKLVEITELQHLDLSNTGLTDDAFASIIQNLKKLKSLNLNNCTELTHLAFLGELKELTYLSLSNCSNLTSAALEEIAQLNGLTQLDLSHCLWLTDAALTTLVQNCTQLNDLDLYFCEKITDASVVAIVQHLIKLKHLDLRSCKALSPKYQRLFNKEEIIALRIALRKKLEDSLKSSNNSSFRSLP